MKTNLFHHFWQISLVLLGAIGMLDAQVVTTTPVFPSENDLITLTFDASQGTGGLNNFTGDVYAHTGVITNLSNNQWTHVKAPWATNLPECKMTRSATNPNIYTLQITPETRTFYGITNVAETAQKLAMVFRNSTGTLEGKATGGTDIFMPLYAAASPLLTIFQSPSTDFGVFNAGATISLTAAASISANCSFFVDGVLVNNANNVTSLQHSFAAAGGGNHTVKFLAVAGTQRDSATYHYVVPQNVVQDAPAGTVNGINYLGGGNVRLQLTAPQKGNVYVIGSFNNWTPMAAYEMKKDQNGNRFWLDIALTPGSKHTYQYYIDGSLRVADPLSEVVLNQWDDSYIPAASYPNRPPFPAGNKATGNVSLIELDLPAYVWQNSANYTRPKKTDLIVYELLVRDFVGAQSFNKVKDSLNYLQKMGVNCIELMPVSEFEGNLSWGYNTSFHGALDKYYGTRTALKQLIDECHRRNIAVVLDIALNHAFSQNPMAQMYWDAANSRPSADNPWFNQTPKHDFNVGYDFNHESQWTREYTVQVCRRWMTDFQVDGFRFDLSKGFTQNFTLGNIGAWGAYDQSRVNIWSYYATQLRATDPNSLLILEHFADNSEEKVLSDTYGFMLWGNGNSAWNEASMGYVADATFATSYKNRTWAQPNLVSFMESHDEERLNYKNQQYGAVNTATGYSVKTLATALKRQEMVAALFFAVPGPKMIWQFGELGYDKSINLCADNTINTNCRIDAKPILWNYLADAGRKNLYNVYSKMLNFRTTEPAFESSSYTTNLTGATKIVKIVDPSMLVIAIANTAVSEVTVSPTFTNTGMWYEFFTGDSLSVASPSQSITLAAGEYRLYTNRRVIVSTESQNTKISNMLIVPNPASEQISIAYNLLGTGSVNIDVFDMLGRKMATLVQNQQQNEGIQQIDYNINDLPQGTYIVRLSANNEQEVRKFIKQ